MEKLHDVNEVKSTHKNRIEKINKTLPETKTTHQEAEKSLNNRIPETYKRPTNFRKGLRDEVWDNAKDKHGRVRDPVSGRYMSKNKQWDMGHKPGYEFKKHQESAARRGISRTEFLNEYNDPNKFRPELPSSNRSHKGEDKTNLYFGD